MQSSSRPIPFPITSAIGRTSSLMTSCRMNAEALRPSTLFPMTDISVSAFMELATGRAGHFGMESGLHSALWLDLDTLFASPTRIEPFIAALADMLRPFRVDAVCGPLLGGAFLA